MNAMTQVSVLQAREAYEPGNATRYELFLTQGAPGALYGTMLYLCWLNAPRHGRCMRIVNDYISLDYLCDKLECNQADGRAILDWLVAQGMCES